MVNASMLYSVMYWRMLSIDANYTHSKLLECLLHDLVSRMKLLDNIQPCTEYVYIMNKLNKRSMLPHNYSVKPILVFLILTAAGEVALSATDSVWNLATSYITIAWPILLHFAYLGITAYQNLQTRFAHMTFKNMLEELLENSDSEESDVSSELEEEVS